MTLHNMRNLMKCNFIMMHCTYYIVHSSFGSDRTFLTYIFTNIKGARLTPKRVLRKTDNCCCYIAIQPNFSQEKLTTIKCNSIRYIYFSVYISLRHIGVSIPRFVDKFYWNAESAYRGLDATLDLFQLHLWAHFFFISIFELSQCLSKSLKLSTLW